MADYLTLVLGLICAAGGGELFVRGTVGLARAAKVPPGIVAATVAAFATSSPELTVAISSALAGTPEISFGNVLGGNVVNIALILGLVLLIRPIVVSRRAIKRDFPIAIILPIVLGALLIDDQLSRLDGLLLLAGFAAWMLAVLQDARAHRSVAAEVLGEANYVKAGLESAFGLALLIAAGKLIVLGASGIAAIYGLSQFVIGAAIVSIGTSTPELATAIISRVRGHDEVGLGTLLGSNVFNGLFIVGVASSISPIGVPLRSAAAPLALGFVALLLIFPLRGGTVDRWRGGLLLALYAVYLTALFEAE